MDEYISKAKFVELMCKKAESNLDLFYADRSNHYHDNAIAYNMAADEAYVFPSADVQPVDRWISVDDRLPPYNKPCVVVTAENGLGVSRLMGRNKLEWTLFGKPVLYWMPLPELPKEGDEK